MCVCLFSCGSASTWVVSLEERMRSLKENWSGWYMSFICRDRITPGRIGGVWSFPEWWIMTHVRSFPSPAIIHPQLSSTQCSWVYLNCERKQSVQVVIPFSLFIQMIHSFEQIIHQAHSKSTFVDSLVISKVNKCNFFCGWLKTATVIIKIQNSKVKCLITFIRLNLVLVVHRKSTSKSNVDKMPGQCCGTIIWTSCTRPR